jgi:protein involved in polysaccharide export with SLBB domain
VLVLVLTSALLSEVGLAQPQSQSLSQSYRLGANDVVKIQVFGEEDLKAESKIDGDGNINFPLLGSLHVAGKTIQELQDYLTSRLEAGYVRAPKVTTYVVKFRNIYMNGEVKAPGGYAYEEGLSVRKALSLAGGLSEKAERSTVRVLRNIDGKQIVLTAGLDNLLLPDDIVVVAEARRFYVSGEVKTPGRYLYEPGMTIHKALSLAGGRTEKAENGSIKVTRVTKGVAETLTAKPEMTVLPDDIIVVEIENYKFYTSGEVKTPGGYPYKDGLTVHKAIAMAGGLTEKAERGTFQVLRQVNGHEETLPVELDSLLLPDDIVVVAEARRFYVSGEVKTPGRYLYEPGMTIHKALSLAGGRTEKAENGSIKVTRVTKGVAETLTAKPEMTVLPDDIIVVEIENYKFYTSGEVKTPGGYPYKDGLTVHKAIAMAGGLTEKAERGTFQVLRQVNGHEETLPVELDSLLLPDDIVVVAEARRFYVSGEVKTPGRYLYEPGMTIHKALSLAGGRTEKAENGSIKVTRVTKGVAETLTAKPEMTVLPDDIIVVEIENYKFYTSGEVKTPGGYPYKDGLTVHKAIAMAGGLTEKAERGTFQVLRQVNGHEETLPVELDSLLLPDDIVVVAEARRFYVSGEVKTPGRYLFEKGMTVHKALSMAGGWTEKAEKGTIMVTRVSDDGVKTMEISLDAPMLPDDFIVIPQLKKVYVNGEVKRAGDFPYDRGLTVHQVITMAGGFTDKAAESNTKVLRKINGQEQSIHVSLDTMILPEDIVVVPRSFF